MGELRTLALCAGIGGLELGLRRAFPSRVVCWVERDAYAQRVLLARMRDGRLDDAPLWDDLSTFDAAEWEGRCDLVAAGFPCQPYSTAGKKLGPADIRDMWPHVARVVAEARPALVALENVARLVRARGGLERVLADLAALGFDAEWCVVRASDVGAPHRRARLFVLGVSDAGREHLRSGPQGTRHGWPAWDSGRALGDSDPAGRGSGPDHGRHAGGRAVALGSGSWPPGPGDRDGWAEVLRTRPDLEPSVCRVAHGAADGLDRDSRGMIVQRRSQLRCLGNAVVPAQAEAAFRELARRAVREAE